MPGNRELKGLFPIRDSPSPQPSPAGRGRFAKASGGSDELTNAAAQFHAGQTAVVTRTVTEQLVQDFARLSGDVQPLHTDSEYGPRTRFNGQIAHGALLIGFISAVLGVEMATSRITMIFLGLNASFTNPVYFGDTITTRCEVKKVREDKPIVTVDCRCLNQDGEEVLTGEAVVYVDPYPIEGK